MMVGEGTSGKNFALPKMGKRFVIPSELREAIPPRWYITTKERDLLAGYEEKRWNEILRNIEKAEETVSKQMILRRMVGPAYPVDFGREYLHLPQHFCQWLGHPQILQVVVQGDAMEIMRGVCNG